MGPEERANHIHRVSGIEQLQHFELLYLCVPIEAVAALSFDSSHTKGKHAVESLLAGCDELILRGGPRAPPRYSRCRRPAA